MSRRRLLRLAACCGAMLLPAVAGAQRPDAVVRGVVHDGQAQPIALAEVLVGDSLRARTDSAGRFVIASLPAGAVELVVRRVGYLPLGLPMTLVAGTTRTFDIELARAAQQLAPVIVTSRRSGISGRLVDSAGAPVAGAEIAVAGVAERVHSGSDGEFAVGDLRATEQLITIRHPDFYLARFSLRLPKRRGQQVLVHLTRLGAELGGGARAAGAGFDALNERRLRELDSRIRVNHPQLYDRAYLAWHDGQDLGEVLNDAVLPVRGAVPSVRGVTSIDPRGTTRSSAAGRPCLFFDGLYPPDEPIGLLTVHQVESIEVSNTDISGTLEPQRAGARWSCTRYIVIRLRH